MIDPPLPIRAHNPRDGIVVSTPRLRRGDPDIVVLNPQEITVQHDHVIAQLLDVQYGPKLEGLVGSKGGIRISLSSTITSLHSSSTFSTAQDLRAWS